MHNLNGNKDNWESFDVILWDHNIEPTIINKTPINDSQVITNGIHFSITDKLFKRFQRLAKKHNFEYETIK